MLISLFNSLYPRPRASASPSSALQRYLGTYFRHFLLSSSSKHVGTPWSLQPWSLQPCSSTSQLGQVLKVHHYLNLSISTAWSPYLHHVLGFLVHQLVYMPLFLWATLTTSSCTRSILVPARPTTQTIKCLEVVNIKTTVLHQFPPFWWWQPR